MKVKNYFLLALGCAAIGLTGSCIRLEKGETEEETQLRQEAVQKEKEQEEKVDLYLKELEKLNMAVKELAAAGQELAELGQANPENVEEMTACVEQMRTWKQTFSDFSQTADPPEGFQNAHKKMAEATERYAALIEAYCDVLIADIQGEEAPDRDQVLSEWEEESKNVASAMGEVREAAGYPAS